MKLLLDQDVYAATARFLLDLGHDVVPVAGIGLSRAQDQEILRVAQEQNRILVTRDRDFGHLVFQGAGRRGDLPSYPAGNSGCRPCRAWKSAEPALGTGTDAGICGC